MKEKRCAKCGCERRITVVGKVSEEPAGITVGFSRVCIPCFLRFCGLANIFDRGKYDYNMAMETVEKAETEGRAE